MENIRDHKYYIIKRGINGKLLDVLGADKKTVAWQIISANMGLGYQLTVVSRTVMMNADNLYEERELLGLPQI